MQAKNKNANIRRHSQLGWREMAQRPLASQARCLPEDLGVVGVFLHVRRVLQQQPVRGDREADPVQGVQPLAAPRRESPALLLRRGCSGSSQAPAARPRPPGSSSRRITDGFLAPATSKLSKPAQEGTQMHPLRLVTQLQRIEEDPPLLLLLLVVLGQPPTLRRRTAAPQLACKS